MSDDEREKLLDLNERLCREYNETEDDTILQMIAATEAALYYDPDHVPNSDGEF